MQRTLIKDTVSPTIDIISPTTGSIVNSTSLNFIVEIYDDHLDKMWYTINSGATKYFFTTNGTIQGWANLPNNPVTITIYANDTVGNVYSIYTTVIKQVPDDGNGNGGSVPEGGVPGYNIHLISGTILVSLCALLVLILKKKKFRNT